MSAAWRLRKLVRPILQVRVQACVTARAGSISARDGMTVLGARSPKNLRGACRFGVSCITIQLAHALKDALKRALEAMVCTGTCRCTKQLRDRACWGTIPFTSWLRIWIRTVLLDDADNFKKGEIVRRAFGPAFGDAILTADGSRWRWRSPPFFAKSGFESSCLR